MNPLVFAFPGNEKLAQRIADACGGDVGALLLRRFPDGETYVRLDTIVADREIVFACTLNDPDRKTLPLLFALAAAREQGARRVGVVVPYLAYLRQDTQFKPGEAVTSATFARLMSDAADWIVTVDPHLHRYRALDAVYSIPSGVVHAAPLISEWIEANIAGPLLIGPDSESEQWVAEVAAATRAPHVVLEKHRLGDRDVDVSVPRTDGFRDRTPVLVDDIISTAQTMITAVKRLIEAGLPHPTCVGVHALFAGDAYEALRAAGPGRIVTCNTIPHPTNAIDVDDAIAKRVHEMMSNSSDPDEKGNHEDRGT